MSKDSLNHVLVVSERKNLYNTEGATQLFVYKL